MKKWSHSDEDSDTASDRMVNVCTDSDAHDIEETKPLEIASDENDGIRWIAESDFLPSERNTFIPPQSHVEFAAMDVKRCR